MKGKREGLQTFGEGRESEDGGKVCGMMTGKRRRRRREDGGGEDAGGDARGVRTETLQCESQINSVSH